MLAGLAACPRRVDQALVRLREGISLGWVAPGAVPDRVLLDQRAVRLPLLERLLDDWIAVEVAKS